VPFDYFGTATNLSISAAVAAYGAFAWLINHDSQEWASQPFRRRAYTFWWGSWAAWVMAWALILLAGLRGQTDSTAFKIVILAFDNLNGILAIVVFIIVTRGDDFGPTKIRLSLLWSLGTLLACTAPLYALSGTLGLGFAYEVHSTWGLCLSVVSPILVGWALHLRFRTVAALAVGFVYGFIQPIVYAAELQAASPTISHVVNNLHPVIAMTLGALKVGWAVVFTQILALGKAGAKGASMVDDQPVEPIRLFKGSSRRLLGHTFVLLIVYTILLVVMFMQYEQSIANFATALGIVGGLIAIFDFFWRMFIEASRRTTATP
jgi:hypothetical protein